MTSFATITAEPSLREDWCYVGLDETSHWRFPAALAPHVAAVITVYAYNRAELTHCCELTPSYWMIGVAYEVRCKPDTPEHIREQLQDIVQETSLVDSDCYRHARGIDKYAERHPELFHALGETEEDTPQAAEDHVHEAWNSNPRF